LVEKFPQAKTFAEVINGLESEFYKQGEVVCRLIVDGHDVEEASESRLGTLQTDQIQTLEVQLQTPEKLIFLVINNWIEKFPNLINSTEALSKQIRLTGTEGNLQNFVDLIDNCQLLVESLISISTILNEQPNLFGDKWAQNEKKMALAIGEALQGFEKKDFVQLADVLEYDIADSLQTWNDLLKMLSESLGRADAKSKSDIESEL
jgi:uncharacterized protein YpiB (UPF0302 family)